MSHSILDMMFSGLNECRILRFDGNRGKAEQKSADGAVKPVQENQVLFSSSLSGA